MGKSATPRKKVSLYSNIHTKTYTERSEYRVPAATLVVVHEMENQSYSGVSSIKEREHAVFFF